MVRKHLSVFRHVAVSLPLLGVLSTPCLAISESNQLISLINDYRQAPGICAGQQAAPAGPLAPDETLAQVQATSDTQWQAALQKAGYRAAQAQAIALSGPASVETAMQAITQRFCAALLNPDYAEIGVSRTANTWQVVLARPLLSGTLGDWSQAGQEVLRQVNQARSVARSCGAQAFAVAPPLSWSAPLAQAALAHSRDMAEHDFFSHSGRDGSQADTRATRQGYVWRGIGENVAAGQGSAKQAIAGWLLSPGHCANLMNPAFTEMGAAYAVNPQSGSAIYWTQVFGTPR